MNLRQMKTHQACLFERFCFCDFRRITGEEAINLVGVFLQYYPRHSFSYIRGRSAWIFLFLFLFFFWVGKGVTPCPSVEHRPWREEAEFARLTPVTLAALSLPGSVMKRLEIHPYAHPPPPPPPPSPLPTTTSEADQTIGMFWRANVKLLLPQNPFYWHHLR